MLIINDANSIILDIYEGGDYTLNIGSETLTLNRDIGGTFDTTDYDDATINRGYVTIHYIS